MNFDAVIQLHVDGLLPKESFKSHHDKPYEELKIVEKELLTLDNYYSLSRYNRSKLYVMAVFEFSKPLSKFF